MASASSLPITEVLGGIEKIGVVFSLIIFLLGIIFILIRMGCSFFCLSKRMNQENDTLAFAVDPPAIFLVERLSFRKFT